MKLLPFGLTFPVHCCCEPNKRLGWVPVPKTRLTSPGPVSYVIGAKHCVQLWPTEEVVPAKHFHTTVELLDSVLKPIESYVCEHGQVHQTVQVIMRHLAVKSNDLPIEQWRKIAGFIEDRSQ